MPLAGEPSLSGTWILCSIGVRSDTFHPCCGVFAVLVAV